MIALAVISWVVLSVIGLLVGGIDLFVQAALCGLVGFVAGFVAFLIANRR